MNSEKGFSLIELLVSLALLISFTSIAVPTFADLIVKIRVDREISRLHRLLLLTKNHAINENINVTICPLSEHAICTTNWHKDLSVFSDNNKNKTFEPALGEYLISTKPSINNNDKLLYGSNRTALIYGPTGQLAIWGGNATFKYCPKRNSQHNRGIVVSRAGRIYQTQKSQSHNRDVNRSGRTITCR